MTKFIWLFAIIFAVTFSGCNQQNNIEPQFSKTGVLSDEYLNIYLGQVSLSRMDIGQVDIQGNN